MLRDNPNEGLLPPDRDSVVSMKEKNRKSVKQTQSVNEEKPARNEGRQSSSSEKKKSRKKKKIVEQSELMKILKFFNIIIGLALIAFAVYCYFYGGLSQSQYSLLVAILPAYIGVSGLMIVMIQCRIGFFVRNMRFLYNFFGRGLFNIYAGLMPLCLFPKIADGESSWTAIQILIVVMVAFMCLVGVLYIMAKIFCCAKEGDKIDKINKRNKENSSDSDSD